MVKYQIQWKDGRVTVEIATSLWLSTPPEESDFSNSESEDSVEEQLPELIVESDDEDSDDDSELEDFLAEPAAPINS